MFDIGAVELMVIAVVAIIVVGPKDLPRLLRQLGQWAGKAREMAREFQNQFTEAANEAGMDDIKKGMEGIGDINPAKNFKKAVDPISDAGKDIANTVKGEAGKSPSSASSANGKSSDGAAPDAASGKAEPKAASKTDANTEAKLDPKTETGTKSKAETPKARSAANQ